MISKFTDIELILVDTNICLRTLRYLPYDDPNVDIWISRDLDSIVNEREKVAVDDWLENYPDKNLHILTDNVQHRWSIAGGMFGFKNSKSHSESSLLKFIIDYSSKDISKNNIYAVDCTIAELFFLKGNNYIQHYGSGKKLDNSKSFPEHEKTNTEHVGEIVDINLHYYELNLETHYPFLTEFKNISLKDGDLFYYSPWSTNCIVKWYNDTDFTMRDIKSDEKTYVRSFKTENGDGLKVLKYGNSIDILWDGKSYKKMMFTDEDTISVKHDSKYYYFSREIEEEDD